MFMLHECCQEDQGTPLPLTHRDVNSRLYRPATQPEVEIADPLAAQVLDTDTHQLQPLILPSPNANNTGSTLSYHTRDNRVPLLSHLTRGLGDKAQVTETTQLSSRQPKGESKQSGNPSQRPNFLISSKHPREENKQPGLV